jgi:hypothetical protein
MTLHAAQSTTPDVTARMESGLYLTTVRLCRRQVLCGSQLDWVAIPRIRIANMIVTQDTASAISHTDRQHRLSTSQTTNNVRHKA